MASMENSMEMTMGIQGGVCVRNCANCVKAREAGQNYRGQPCYTCRRKPGEPETLRHLSRLNCEDHEFLEEKLARLGTSRPVTMGTTYLQMAAF